MNHQVRNFTQKRIFKKKFTQIMNSQTSMKTQSNNANKN